MTRLHATFHRLVGLAVLSTCAGAAADAARSSSGTIRFAGSIVAPPHEVTLAPAASSSSDSASAPGIHVHFSGSMGQSAHVRAHGVGGRPIGIRCMEAGQAAAGGCMLDSKGGTIAVAALTIPGDSARRPAILTVAYD